MEGFEKFNWQETVIKGRLKRDIHNDGHQWEILHTISRKFNFQFHSWCDGWQEDFNASSNYC